ncbi:hypothetical protein FGB62_92g044 [Gracilaria domingensis]|nr:hypothetical protein FGB62_92g044 [Gracilaria domingensis]
MWGGDRQLSHKRTSAGAILGIELDDAGSAKRKQAHLLIPRMRTESMAEGKMRRCSKSGAKVEQTDNGGAELATRGVLPTMIKLLPPRALIVGRGAYRPVRRKRTALEPVKDVEGDDCVQDVDDGPGVEGSATGKQAGKQTHGGDDGEVEGPRSRRVEPLHAHVVGLRAVASLHAPVRKGAAGLTEEEESATATAQRQRRRGGGRVGTGTERPMGGILAGGAPNKSKAKWSARPARGAADATHQRVARRYGAPS